jgi:hypothetical protein
MGADLQSAKDLDRADLQGTLADGTTRWPAGWTQATAEARGVQPDTLTNRR